MKHKIEMCQSQIKIMVIIPSQELQSSVQAEPKIRAGGRQPTEKYAFQSVVNCQYLETLGACHAGWGSCAHPVLQHGIGS